MNWGLTQGLVGTKQRTLSPSMTALGPNRYLTPRDFAVMLGAALAVHVVVIVIASMLPSQKVHDIPVRALSFKLGDQDRVAAYSGVAIPVTAAPVVPAPTMSADSWRASPGVTAPVVPKPLRPIKPVERAVPAPVTPVKQPKIIPVTEPVRQMPEENKPALAPLPQPVVQEPAIAPAPQRYIREVGAPSAAAVAALAPASPQGAIGGQGAETTQTEATSQIIRERYEQQISEWIEVHKLYPAAAGGREGRAVVRMRIDRTGYVRYYAIEQSAGNPALDAAAIDMIRRANPVPAVPANYPAGNLIEFLIPIHFQAPQ